MVFNRLGRVFQQSLDPDKVGVRRGRQPTLDSLLPGDVVSLWDHGDCIVQSVLQCSEDVNGRVTRWRWNLLDGGRMLESAPDGNVLYTRTDVLTQEFAGFETLTCDVEHGGVLKAFEARVQAGTAARNPVLFEHGGGTFRVISTGTFAAELVGATEPAAFEVWRDVHPTRPGENVYFELDPTQEPEDGVTESVVLGIWTTHIALLFGQPLTSADIQSIYPRAEEGLPRQE